MNKYKYIYLCKFSLGIPDQDSKLKPKCNKITRKKKIFDIYMSSLKCRGRYFFYSAYTAKIHKNMDHRVSANFLSLVANLQLPMEPHLQSHLV